MAETAVTAQPNRKRQLTLILILAAIVLLPLLYVGGTIVLPVSILANYASRDCPSTLSLNGLYTWLYPAFIEDQTLNGPVMECAVYTLASQQEGDENWQDSSNAFKVYSSAYPNGLFMAEARERGLNALINLAREQAGSANYADALNSLRVIQADYVDTGSSVEAAHMYPEIYTAWGVSLRDSGQFEEAQGVFTEFKAWAQDHQQLDQADVAQGELALIYLNWGLDLQSQRQFEEANAKFDLASSIDPEVAGQVQAVQEKLHSEWGDDLMEQKEFAEAIGHYELAAALAEARDPNAAKNITANGYVQWAAGLSADEDFIGALAVLDFIDGSIATESMKNTVDEARSKVYIGFSASFGEQARQAMNDAVRTVCAHQVEPSLPIFGLDKENIRAGMYGVDGALPVDIAAMTPGELHYVACVEEDTNVIESSIHAVGSFVFDPNPPYRSVKVQYTRHLYAWTVTLREVDAGREFNATVIEGGEPPPLPTTPQEIYGGAKSPQYFGTKPDIADLSDWLLAILE